MVQRKQWDRKSVTTLAEIDPSFTSWDGLINSVKAHGYQMSTGPRWVRYFTPTKEVLVINRCLRGGPVLGRVLKPKGGIRVAVYEKDLGASTGTSAAVLTAQGLMGSGNVVEQFKNPAETVNISQGQGSQNQKFIQYEEIIEEQL